MSALPLAVSQEMFERNLLEQIRSCESGISEYDLITSLRQKDQFEIDNNELLSGDSLIMFQIHFTLYHFLYRLRDKLRTDQSHELELSPVCIVLKEYQSVSTTESDTGVIEHDPLYEYYIDIDNLYNTNTEDVVEMLDRFWLRLDNSERRAEALQELGLKDPVSNEEIRKQFRKMAMKHHPDRGGDKNKLQAINSAVSVLRNSYNLDS